MFRQQFGVELSRKTMGSWQGQSLELLMPVYRVIREDLQRGNYNTGHDKYCLPSDGVGPDKDCLTDEQRWDLIEYLKSL